MIIKDIMELVSKEKKKVAQAKATRKFALGVGISTAAGILTGVLFAPNSGKKTREDLKKKAASTIEVVRDTTLETAAAIKDSAVHASEEVHETIKNIHEKADNVKNDFIGGMHEIKKDIMKTEENISDELKKPVK